MEKAVRIPERSEIPEKDKWAITDIYASDDLWEVDIQKIIDETPNMAAYAGKLANNAEMLYEYLQKSDIIGELAQNIMEYAARRNDEDSRVSTYQAMLGRGMSALVAYNAATAFDIPEIMSMSEETIDEFYISKPELELYRRYLFNIRRRKAHILSPAEEKIMAATGEMMSAPEDIFSKFSDADMTFPDALDDDGNAHPISHGTYIGCVESADRTLRKNSFESMYNTHASYKNTFAATLSANVKALKFNADIRNYNSSLEAALSATNVPVDVYYNLISAVHANMNKMHRYVALRKKMLKLDELHFYDLYTPLVTGIAKKIPFESAKKTVFEALMPLGDYYRSILQDGFENRWIDVYQNVGKRSGAYSAGALQHPFVLLNYNGSLDDQFTLAHEMGHAIHSFLSNKNQPAAYRDYVIFVAEVASTCNEALLMQYLLSKTTDKQERIYLINHFLDQFKGTLYRQTMFAEFELIISNLNAEGTALTAECLCQEYKNLNKLYYGNDIIIDEGISYEWERIPHFYYNYYVFQYATGYSAAIALSSRILKEGKPAVDDYIKFLSSGCSQDPIDLLKIAGVDMSGPEPINEALNLFGELLDEMEVLISE